MKDNLYLAFKRHSERPLRQRIETLEAALSQIANCKGLYGAQAFEFQQIAQRALAAGDAKNTDPNEARK